MKLKSLKILIAAVLISATSILFISCASNYDEDWIIGKTSEEIAEKYGEFDCIVDVSLRGYKTKEAHKGFFGTDPEEFYMIYFNSDGVAFKVEEDWVRPGG